MKTFESIINPHIGCANNVPDSVDMMKTEMAMIKFTCAQQKMLLSQQPP